MEKQLHQIDPPRSKNRVPPNRGPCPRCGTPKTENKTEATRLQFPYELADIYGAFDKKYVDRLTDEEKEDLREKLGLDELTEESYDKARTTFFNGEVSEESISKSKLAFKSVNEKKGLHEIMLERYYEPGGFLDKIKNTVKGTNKVVPKGSEQTKSGGFLDKFKNNKVGIESSHTLDKNMSKLGQKSKSRRNTAAEIAAAMQDPEMRKYLGIE